MMPLTKPARFQMDGRFKKKNIKVADSARPPGGEGDSAREKSNYRLLSPVPESSLRDRTTERHQGRLVQCVPRLASVYTPTPSSESLLMC